MNHWVAVVRKHEKLGAALSLAVTIAVIWCWFYERLNLASWREPVTYHADAWLVMGTAKAYMDGQVWPLLYKTVANLNAPFSANWNDYPVTEDLLYAAIGWTGRLTGLFAAANLALLMAHVLAGISFWFVARKLGHARSVAWAGGLVYAFCWFILSRGLAHLPLSYYWHVPLLLLVVLRAFADDSMACRSREFAGIAAICLVCGASNPYYSAMFLQLLGFAVLLHLVRGNMKGALMGCAMIGITMASFLVMNLDTLVYGFVNGGNSGAAARDLVALEVYGLKIPNMLFTPGKHIVGAFSSFSQRSYYSRAYLDGEFWGPYLGFAAIAGIGLLFVVAAKKLAQGRATEVPPYFWLVVWVLAFSLVGGLNLLLGSLGFVYLRGTNRYSIFVLTIGLLFLTDFLSRHCPPRGLYIASAALLLLGLGEQLPRHYLDPVPKGAIAAQVAQDRAIATRMEAAAPGASVFQLPVAGFPEVPPIHKMDDYEHFRPYFFTHTLHYSYGTDKGRGEAEWQSAVAALPAAEMARKLEAYGFGFILINRKGFSDAGAQLLTGLRDAGRQVIGESADFFAVALRPAAVAQPVDPWVSFAAGWSTDEVTHRWAIANTASLRLNNPGGLSQSRRLSFVLSALSPRTVSVAIDGVVRGQVVIAQPGVEYAFSLDDVQVASGGGKVTLRSDASGVVPGNGDGRSLTFRLARLSWNAR